MWGEGSEYFFGVSYIVNVLTQLRTVLKNPKFFFFFKSALIRLGVSVYHLPFHPVFTLPY